MGPTEEFNQPSIFYRIAVNWENGGNTQTGELEIGTALHIDAVPSESPQWTDPISGRYHVLLPKASIDDLSLTIGGAELNQVRDRSIQIIIFSFAKYLDIFYRKHVTLACFQIFAPSGDFTKEGARGATAGQCSDYNCADQDCDRYRSTPAVAKILSYLK